MSGEPRTAGIGPRLLLAQALVIAAGSVTLLAVALGLAPGLFRRHLDRAAGPISDELSAHLGEAFASAVLTSLAVAVLAATAAALVVSWVVTRRVVRPLQAMAEAAELIAAGRYGARVRTTGLGTEVEALERAFNKMAGNLAATERTRSEMWRDLAHELRTPLTTVRGYVEALADGVVRPGPDTTDTLDAELARVERLVDDIAMVSRAEERQLHLRRRPVPPGELVAAAVAAAASSYDAGGVALVPEVESGLPPVSVDADRMQEVLANLLDNALRHTPTGGRVSVTVRRHDQAVELVVTDDGAGLATEHLPRVFERFYRADNGRARTRGGSGIGLAIARALVEAHGGHIRADSAGPGRGSTFTVTLPGGSPVLKAPGIVD